jgi:hypothetical protein
LSLDRTLEVYVPRPRHPRTDLEQLLRMAEAHGWRVEKGSKYYRLLEG